MDDVLKLLNELTIEEKASLLSGHKSWFTNKISRLDIPRITLTDGPHGLRMKRIDSKSKGLGETEISTCFPAASTSGCSWNVEILSKMGHTMAEECRYYDVNVILGPAVNIKRNPLCGRNFEYFSEDPVITGKLGGALAKGIEDNGVGTSVKHYACNNNEENRYVGDSVVDLRCLHEIYLKGFELIVKEAKPQTIMCAYNKINGTFASENKYLLTDVLRSDWGFNGVVMSDWGAVNDRVLGIKAGLDLEMPGDIAHNRQIIVDAVSDGTLSIEELDKAVLNVLNLIKRKDNFVKLNNINLEENSKISYKVSVDSAVLLKNNDNILPLKKEEKFLVIGELFSKMRYQGAGSSLIRPYKLVNPKDAFDENNVEYKYLRGYDCNSLELDQKLIEEVIKEIEYSDKILFFGGLSEDAESEGFDRKDMKLPINQIELIKELVKHNKKIIFIFYGGSPIEIPEYELIDAMLAMYLPGQEGGNSTYDLLFGNVSPSGRLSETWPLSANDVAFANEFTKTRNDLYKESIFVGYRYYNTFNCDVRFPFGYGLSYTSFDYNNLNIIKDNDKYIIRVDVKNTGKMLGSEVVELYVNSPKGNVIRPLRELKGFTKVKLEPNEIKTVEIIVLEKDLKCYLNNQWLLEEGIYSFEICKDVNNVILRKEIQIKSNDVIIKDEKYYNLYQNKEIINMISDEDYIDIACYIPNFKEFSKPYDLNTPIGQYKTFFGKMIFKLLMFVFKTSWKKAKKSKDSLDKETKIKNAYFTYKLMPYLSLRAMSYTSEGVLTHRMALGLLDIANNHVFKGLWKIITKERCFKLPE